MHCKVIPVFKSFLTQLFLFSKKATTKAKNTVCTFTRLTKTCSPSHHFPLLCNSMLLWICGPWARVLGHPQEYVCTCPRHSSLGQSAGSSTIICVSQSLLSLLSSISITEVEEGEWAIFTTSCASSPSVCWHTSLASLLAEPEPLGMKGAVTWQQTTLTAALEPPTVPLTVRWL